MSEIFSLFLELLLEFIVCTPPDKEKHPALYGMSSALRLTLAGIVAIALLIVVVFIIAKLFLRFLA